MATQFMPPSSYMAAPPVMGYHGYTNGKSGAFAFRKRIERVDWRKISMVDIENISRTLDFTTLQENIMNITFCNLEAELDIRTVDPNFVKLFKLAQLTIEYLLHSQEFLATLCASLEEKAKLSDQEIEKIKQQVEALQKELAEVKKESHKRKKMLIAQQQLLHVGNESYNKCPFCAKAFINNSYLQSHIIRRHSASAGNKDGSSSVSPDLGVGSESVRNILETENILLKEKIYKYETERHLKKDAVTIRNNNNKNAKITATQVNQISSVPIENVEEGEKVGKSAVLMTELRELNSKYQASQKALRELEVRTGGKRSYLGDLEDEVENEKELLKEQRSEVAAFKEQLQQQLDLMKNHMETKLSKQEVKWQKRVQNMTQEHASEIKKLNNALETTSQPQDELHNHKQLKQQEVQEILRQSREREKELEIQEQQIEKEMIRSVEFKAQRLANTARGETTKSTTPRGGTEKAAITPGVRHSQMYPSDDEKSAGFGTGTSSLRTFQSGTGRSTLGQTGTQSLHTMQFLEELRKNPTLGVMREQLAELLQEQVEKKGIPPNQTGITDEVLRSKLDILSTQRQTHIQKYPDFNEWRDYFNKKATEEAKKQLRMQSSSPWGQPPHAGARRRLDLLPPSSHHSPNPASGPRSGPPHPQQHLSAQRTTPRSPGSQGGVSSNARPQPHPRATTPQNGKRALSTGSTTEWTSTQFDSDDDSLEEGVFPGGKLSGPTGTRLIQSGPARGPGGPTPSPRSQGPKTRVIQSRPMSSGDVGDIDFDRYERKSVSVPVSPKRTGSIVDRANIIEKKLENRTTNDKPVGGVNVGLAPGMRKQTGVEGDSDVDNDWDDNTEPAEPAPAKRVTGRGSTDASNTYGSSAWGSSSKAASTIKDKERRSTSRSSFVSVTDVSSDEDGI